MINNSLFLIASPNNENFNTLKKQLQTLIGTSTDDLEDICASTLIKKWSKYKPIDVDKELNITDTDRYNANQGFSLSFTSGTSGIPYQVFGLIAQSGPSWTYVHPSKYRRIRDFHGYNHAITQSPFKMPESVSQDGITVVENDTSSTTHIHLWCYFHQYASPIQPVDMAFFNDIKDSYYFKFGILLLDPTNSYVNLYMMYDSIEDAAAGDVTKAVDMPLSVSSDVHYQKKIIRIPNTTAGSSLVWNAILVCVRVNKATKDMMWTPLPTERLIKFTIGSPEQPSTGDVDVFWAGGRTDMKPLTIVIPAVQNGIYMVQDIYFTNIFANITKFFESTNLNFIINYQLYYSADGTSSPSQAGNNSITEDTYPLSVEGEGDTASYTYRTAIRNGTGTMIPVTSFENLIVYISIALDNGDANSRPVYLKLDEIAEVGQRGYLRIPKGSSSPVGYSLQSIMNALGEDYYEIVQYV